MPSPGTTPAAKWPTSWNVAPSAATTTLARRAYSEWIWARPSMAAMTGTRMLAMFFQDLNAFVMDLAPYAGIGNVGERRPIHTDHEVPSRPREDYDLIRSIL